VAGKRKKDKPQNELGTPRVEGTLTVDDYVSRLEQAQRRVTKAEERLREATREVEEARRGVLVVAYMARSAQLAGALVDRKGSPVTELPTVIAAAVERDFDPSSASVLELIVEYARRNATQNTFTPKELLEGIEREFGRTVSNAAITLGRNRHPEIFDYDAGGRGLVVIRPEVQRGEILYRRPRELWPSRISSDVVINQVRPTGTVGSSPAAKQPAATTRKRPK
jgi:hypothetical protein